MNLQQDSVLFFLTRAGCCLCDDALEFVGPLASAYALTLERVDVDSDRELKREYGLRIPVVLLDGQVLGEGRIASEDFSRRLSAAMLRRTL